MTREEEINKAADKYSDNRNNYAEWSDYWQELNDIEFVEKAFIEGAKWAEDNPKEGLISIDKVCNYLENINIGNYMDSGIFQMYDLINDFRKAMEE